MKIALLNYNHHDKIIGGVETRYRLLGKALTESGHECVYISTESMCLEEVVLRSSECDLAISDSAVGFSTVCPMITIFGNAWRGVLLCGENEHIKHVINREQLWHKKHNSLRVAVSHYMRDMEMAPSGIKSDHVVPNPVDIDRFRGCSKRTTSRPTILWVGPRIPVKNPTAMEYVRGILGDGVVWKFVCRNDETAVNYDGMTRALAGASVVLCTSVAEGCSNTLMEAIAADVPIVTTSTGIFWDWWNSKLGVRIPESGTPKEIAEGILKVLNNPDKFSPRQVAMDHGLAYSTWSKRWQWLVEDYVWRCMA